MMKDHQININLKICLYFLYFLKYHKYNCVNKYKK